MRTEFEAKFLGVDFDDIRARLQNAGALCELPMRQMRRVTIDTPELKKNNAYLRVRDEGNKITVTLKQHTGNAVDEAKEINVVVNSFDHTVELLRYLNFPYHSTQETKRETWKLGDAEVVLDEWPWLKPYMEIEANDEQAVKDCAAMLGLNWSDAVFGDVMTAYAAQYPHLRKDQNIGDIKELKFGMSLPDLLKGSNS